MFLHLSACLRGWSASRGSVYRGGLHRGGDPYRTRKAGGTHSTGTLSCLRRKYVCTENNGAHVLSSGLLALTVTCTNRNKESAELTFFSFFSIRLFVLNYRDFPPHVDRCEPGRCCSHPPPPHFFSCPKLFRINTDPSSSLSYVQKTRLTHKT